MSRITTSPVRLVIPLIVTCVGAASAQPANDSCSTPTAISGYATFDYDQTGATTDGPQGTACESVCDNDVWFCWTAPETGPVTIETCGVAFTDTVLAIYGGCACPGGAPIGCNDDTCGLLSQVGLDAVAGVQYMIRVGDFEGNAPAAGQFIVRSGLPNVLAGPFNNPANGHDYYLLEPSPWTAAQAKAMQLGGDLVTVNDFDENEFCRASVLGFDFQDRRGWLGFNDFQQEGNFVWVSGESSSFTNWNGGEPNDSGGVEDYAEMFGSNGQWNDQPNQANVTIYGIVEVGEPGCPADYDGDGFVTGLDFDAFVADFEAGDPNADFDEDGFITGLDFDAYVLAFEAGCA